MIGRCLAVIAVCLLSACHPRYGFDVENHTAAPIRVDCTRRSGSFFGQDRLCSDIAPGGRARWRSDHKTSRSSSSGWSAVLVNPTDGSAISSHEFVVKDERPRVLVVREVDGALVIEPVIVP